MPGRFHHFDHECALSLCQIIGCAHTGKDTVADAEPGLAGRDERTHLGKQADQGRLPQNGGFARHVRTRYQQKATLLIHVQVIGHKGCFADNGFHHGMTSFTDGHVLIRAQNGSGPVVPRRGFGEGLPVVELGQNIGHEQNARSGFGQNAAQVLEQPVLKAFALVGGRKQLFFEFLELRGGESFGIDKRLATDEMLRGVPPTALDSSK